MTYDANDKVIFGDSTPFGIGSLSSYLTYKQFSLGTSFRYSFGGSIYNQTLATKVEGSDPRYNADERVFNDRWKQPGDIAKYKKDKRFERSSADISIPSDKQLHHT